MKKSLDLLLSLKMTLFLLFLLGIGAAIATFIENDFGTSSARVLVYDHWWYETVMGLSGLNLLGVIIRRKMWRRLSLFLFHAGFLVILLGAGLTRYVGQEGILHIREGKSENRMISTEPYLQVTIQSHGKKYYQLLRLACATIADFYRQHTHVVPLFFAVAIVCKGDTHLIPVTKVDHMQDGEADRAEEHEGIPQTF